MKTNKLKLPLLASLLLSSSLSLAGIVEDSLITTAVKAKMLIGKDIPVTSIEVTTKDNEVFLKGKVDTSVQADKAVELAASLENVTDVDYTELLVQESATPATDSLITAKVKGKITQLFNDNKITAGYNLTTETTNKEVHISGTVADENDISNIENTVKSFKDVTTVKTDIQVIKK